MTSGDEPQSEHPADEAGETSATQPMIGAARRAEEEAVDDLVDGMFRDVDDRFSTLEARYAAARQKLTTADVEESLARPDPIAASAARYELVSEVATLRADVERQAAELDERDRMLAELSNRIEGFEERLLEADTIERAATTTRQELHEERRELARVRALLEASAAERAELSDVAQRLKHDKDHAELLLESSIERFEESERARLALDENIERLESTRQTEQAEHTARLDELTDAKAAARRLADLVDDLTAARDEAIARADKAESKNERRGNEVNYLNRRIESLTERASESDHLGADVKRLTEENAVLSRRIGDLERELETQTAHAVASAAAVEAIADRSAQHDDLIARIAELEEAAERRNVTPPVAETSSELQDLAQRARSLGSQRSSGAYAPLSSEAVAAQPPTPIPAPAPFLPPPPAVVSESIPTAGLPSQASTSPEPLSPEPLSPEPLSPEPLSPEPLSPEPLNTTLAEPVIEAPQLVVPADEPAVPPVEPLAPVEVPLPPAAPALAIPLPSDAPVPPAPIVSVGGAEPEIAASEVVAPPVPVEAVDPTITHAPVSETLPPDIEQPVGYQAPALALPLTEGLAAEPTPSEPTPSEPTPSEPTPSPVDTGRAPILDVSALAVPQPEAEPSQPTVPEITQPEPVQSEPQAEAATATPSLFADAPGRSRIVLPPQMQPDTPEAVEHLLSQPGVTAVVDARSFCGRTGVRPSELFARIEGLRDRFDVPVEVVVTPVSTPVGGAPQLAAIGVHHVTGADTVSDRVRALCLGFPPDQPIVVIAGDDHVRRAAIGEEANVIDPAVVLDVT